MWTEASMLRVLENVYGPAVIAPESIGNGPAHYYQFQGFHGKVGFISSISHKFCENCNRIRLTSDGFLKACLQYQVGMDMKQLLRSKESDERILQCIQEVLDKKPTGHQFFEEKTEKEEALLMAQIGG